MATSHLLQNIILTSPFYFSFLCCEDCGSRLCTLLHLTLLCSRLCLALCFRNNTVTSTVALFDTLHYFTLLCCEDCNSTLCLTLFFSKKYCDKHSRLCLTQLTLLYSAVKIATADIVTLLYSRLCLTLCGNKSKLRLVSAPGFNPAHF